MGRLREILVLLVVLANFCDAAVETVNSDLTVEKADRSIDISSQLVKINAKITLSNGGRGAVNGFHYAVEEAMKDNVVFIGATVR